MTTVLTRIQEITEKEGFNLWYIRRHGRLVKVTKNGVLGVWPHRNKTKETHTVKEFRDKFAAAYPGCTCDVLKGDGTIAHGNKTLRQVRTSY